MLQQRIIRNSSCNTAINQMVRQTAKNVNLDLDRKNPSQAMPAKGVFRDLFLATYVQEYRIDFMNIRTRPKGYLCVKVIEALLGVLIHTR